MATLLLTREYCCVLPRGQLQVSLRDKCVFKAFCLCLCLSLHSVCNSTPTTSSSFLSYLPHIPLFPCLHSSLIRSFLSFFNRQTDGQRHSESSRQPFSVCLFLSLSMLLFLPVGGAWFNFILLVIQSSSQRQCAYLFLVLSVTISVSVSVSCLSRCHVCLCVMFVCLSVCLSSCTSLCVAVSVFFFFYSILFFFLSLLSPLTLSNTDTVPPF